MKPENLSPNVNIEKMPSLPRPNIEYLDKTNIDSGVEKGAERVEQTAELRAVVNDVSNTTQTVVIDDRIAVANPDVVESATNINNPTTAKDEDLIEKEWVDRAKKIVDETNGDPYLREEEVNKLQTDYLKKRYGRDVSISE